MVRKQCVSYTPSEAVKGQSRRFAMSALHLLYPSIADEVGGESKQSEAMSTL
jgi:hypothetical protein